MAIAFWIERSSGCIRIGDVRLEPGQAKGEIEPRVAPLVGGSRDHGNGYEWLELRGLSFGGEAAALSLCFHDGRFEEASWSVQLPDAPEGWPTREAIDAEIAFVRRILASQLDFDPAREEMRFAWGEVWSSLDPKGFLASNGLRYRRR